MPTAGLGCASSWGANAPHRRPSWPVARKLALGPKRCARVLYAPSGLRGGFAPACRRFVAPTGGQSQAAQRAPVMRGESAPRPIAQAAFSAQGLHKRLRRPCAVCRQRSGRGLPSSPRECVPRIPPRRGATVAPFGRFPSLAVAPAGRARARENKKALPWQRY